MENYEGKIALERDLEKFSIEKSIEGSPSFLLNKDMEAGLSSREILMKGKLGVYSNNGVFKSDYDDLEKALRPGEVIRGIDDFKITKKGSDIKLALQNGLKELTAMKTKCYLKIEAAKALVGEEPTKEWCENHKYMCEGYTDRLDIPKEYDTSYKSDSKQQVNEVVLYADGNTPEPEKNIRGLKYNYNDMLYNYTRICVDIMKLETTIEAVNEKKSYTMSVDLASKMNL